MYCLDDCRPGCDYGAIMGFILTDDAQKWTLKTKEERKQAVLEQYAKHFRTDAAFDVIDYVEQDWNQESDYVRGGAVSIPEIGSFVRTFEDLRFPVKRVHFAGTELATEWAGYMDGAIQSGERAADEVLHALFRINAKPKQYPSLIETRSANPGTLDLGLAYLYDVAMRWCGN